MKRIKQNTETDAGKKRIKNELNWADGTLTVEEVRNILQLSKTKTYDLVNRGEFPIMKIDSVIRIPRTGFDKWFREMCA